MTTSNSAIIELTAIELSKAIHAKKISCLEVMQAYLHQIEKLNPKVNAIVSMVDGSNLLDQARAMDVRIASGDIKGWMTGFPLAPKDLTATAGIATTLGSPILKKNVTASDSIVVERMRSSGAILIGKTNVPEFGLGSNTYNTVFGNTLNAYDTSKTAGGSSGGSAVSLALNMQPVADGSDMGGSLRNPAAWNNIYGFRPSRGRVPFGPTVETFYEQLGIEGPMARNVPDLAMFLSVQAGYDARAPLSLLESPEKFKGSLERSFKGSKIAWMNNFNGYLPMESGLLELSEQALSYFQVIGCEVESAIPSFDFAKLWDCWLKLRAFLVSGKLRMFYNDPAKRALLKPEAVWEAEQGISLSALQVYEASEVRSAWAQELNRMFKTYDYLVLPTTQVFPFDVNQHWPNRINGITMDTYHRWMEVVIGGTLAGLPVLSIPAGFNKDGLPIGLQVIGRPNDDFGVLQLGYAWQQATPFASIKPSLLSS